MKKKNTMLRLLRYLKKYWLLLMLSLLFAALTVAMTLYLPILIGQAVDLIVAPGQVEFSAIARLLLKMGILIGATALSQWIMNACNNRITYRTVRDIRSDAFARLEILPLRYIDAHSYGEIVSRMIADVDQFADGLLMGFTQFFTGVLTIVGTLLFMLWMNPLITLVVVLAASKRLTIIPTNKFTNMVEYGYEFVKKDMGESAIGHGYKKHLPFLATLFFFILISNFVGLIPGCKTPTGSISITWALAAISFIYFIFWGIKAKGLGGYLKSFAPSGLPLVMVPIVWFLELFSTVLRVLTLAVRLYGNMFAGHMVLGIFALLTSVFIGSAIQGAGVGVGSISIAWMLFLFAMYALEVLVAFLQAYVFTILSAVYIGLATSDH